MGLVQLASHLPWFQIHRLALVVPLANQFRCFLNWQGASRTGGRLNVFSAVQLAATGDKAYIVAVPITEVNEPMEWWLILLIVLVAASTVIGVVVYCWAKPRPPPHEKYGTQMAPMSNANYPAGQL